MSDPSVGIGAVVEELRVEFPDVSISKVRYLEARGLISPVRSSKGTRRFDRPTVARLREILRIQRDEFLPLEVIGRRLESWSPDDTPVQEGPLSATELAEAAGIDARLVDDLASHGLLRPVRGQFPPSSLAIARAAAELVAAGLEPRHLRLLRSGVEQVTERVAATTRAVARGRSGEATRKELSDRMEHAVRRILAGITDEEFDRLRAE